jgi:uncharacterized protein YjbI with pentapeptide repeats
LPGAAIAIALSLGSGGLGAGAAIAANPDQVQRLLTTRQCPGCDLRQAGLVYADLRGADLRGADLRGANLSRAQLATANLDGADLRGTSLFGADLSMASLRQANLGGADLREATVTQADFDGAITTNAGYMGAVGLPPSLADARTRLNWGIQVADRRNYPAAIDYYNQAIALDPNLAEAYLNRSAARAKLADYGGAIADARQAETLFNQRNDATHAQIAQEFYTQLETYLETAAEGEQGGGNGWGIDLLNFVRGVGSYFIPFLF